MAIASLSFCRTRSNLVLGFMNGYDVDIGRYLYTPNRHSLMAAWLNVSENSKWSKMQTALSSPKDCYNF